jgi:hypothetical protein
MLLIRHTLVRARTNVGEIWWSRVRMCQTGGPTVVVSYVFDQRIAHGHILYNMVVCLVLLALSHGIEALLRLPSSGK